MSGNNTQNNQVGISVPIILRLHSIEGRNRSGNLPFEKETIISINILFVIHYKNLLRVHITLLTV